MDKLCYKKACRCFFHTDRKMSSTSWTSLSCLFTIENTPSMRLNHGKYGGINKTVHPFSVAIWCATFERRNFVLSRSPTVPLSNSRRFRNKPKDSVSYEPSLVSCRRMWSCGATSWSRLDVFSVLIESFPREHDPSCLSRFFQKSSCPWTRKVALLRTTHLVFARAPGPRVDTVRRLRNQVWLSSSSKLSS